MAHSHCGDKFSKFYKTKSIILEVFNWFKIQYLLFQQLLYPKDNQVKLWWGVLFFTNVIYSISILIIFIPGKLLRFYHQ